MQSWARHDRTMANADPCTDLIANLFDAADNARGSSNARLILLSDMLQSTPSLNVEPPHSAPDAGWVDRAKTTRVIPDLNGVCVFAVGGAVSDLHGVRLKEFWERYMAAAGASLKDYRRTVPDAHVLRC
jgi:hypothetical protein